MKPAWTAFWQRWDQRASPLTWAPSIWRPSDRLITFSKVLWRDLYKYRSWFVSGEDHCNVGGQSAAPQSCFTAGKRYELKLWSEILPSSESMEMLYMYISMYIWMNVRRRLLLNGIKRLESVWRLLKVDCEQNSRTQDFINNPVL